MRIKICFFLWVQEGLTAEETEKKEPDDAERMQVFYPFLTIYVLSSLFDFSWGMSFDHVMSWFWMQMTDARCPRCSEIKVGLRDIIQAGHGDRYEVLCAFP